MDTQYHGGGCCGVRHIFNMDRSTIADLDRQIAAVDAIPANGGSRTSGRLIEIILSSRQVGDRNPRGAAGRNWAPCVEAAGGWPAVLAERGFRLVSRFENKNSGADCYIFHRVPNFKSLVDLPFAWTHEANPGRVLEAGAAPQPARRAGEFRVGDVVIYNNPGNPNHGHSGRIDSIYADGTAMVSQNVNRTSHRWSLTNLRLNAGNHAAAAPAIPPMAPRPTVVATFYANFLARTNARGGFFPTLEACRNAAPNCARRDRIEIMSDGQQRVTERV